MPCALRRRSFALPLPCRVQCERHPLVHDVVTVDLRSGQTRLLARLPERGLALTVDAERVYVATAYGSTVETVDVASGKRGRPLPVGRGPVAVVSQVF